MNLFRCVSDFILFPLWLFFYIVYVYKQMWLDPVGIFFILKKVCIYTYIYLYVCAYAYICIYIDKKYNEKWLLLCVYGSPFLFC